MAPSLSLSVLARVNEIVTTPTTPPTHPTESSQSRIQGITEAWAQGFHVGAIIILILVTLCNYRKRVLLHKLILLELFLALWHGTFIFFEDPVYGWYLSATAAPLYISYNVHNIVSWLKIKPFLPRWGGHIFLITLVLAQPYWILETWANFEYFNSLGNDTFKISRFLEPVFRDPWWVFTTVKLCLVIKNNYDMTLSQLLHTSPRFGILLLCMMVSIVFLVTDIIVTVRISTQSGINPFWRLALVFKCASDAIFLDDFKSVLDRIVKSVMRAINNDAPYDTQSRNSMGRRRRSTIGGHGVHLSPHARTLHTVTISSAADRDRNEYEMKTAGGGGSSWPRSKFTTHRSLRFGGGGSGGGGGGHGKTFSGGGATEPLNGHQRLLIQAETTIEISEQRKSSGVSDPFGSEDDTIQVKESASMPEYGWATPADSHVGPLGEGDDPHADDAPMRPRKAASPGPPRR